MQSVGSIDFQYCSDIGVMFYNLKFQLLLSMAYRGRVLQFYLYTFALLFICIMFCLKDCYFICLPSNKTDTCENACMVPPLHIAKMQYCLRSVSILPILANENEVKLQIVCFVMLERKYLLMIIMTRVYSGFEQNKLEHLFLFFLIVKKVHTFFMKQTDRVTP